MIGSSLRIPIAIFAFLAAGKTARAEPLPDNGRYNLRCPITIRTISGPSAPKNGTLNFAVDITLQQWCLPSEGCKDRYALHRVAPSALGYSAIELVENNSFARHERALINLATGKLVGSSDDAPNGLVNGFWTYLLQGQCSLMPYSEVVSSEDRQRP